MRELTTRERKRDKLDIVPLTPSALSEFTARWQEVQAGFVDNPASAVGVADRLVTEVMRQRGIPSTISTAGPRTSPSTTRRSSKTIALLTESRSRSSMPTPSSSEKRSCITGRCSRGCWKRRPTIKHQQEATA